MVSKLSVYLLPLCLYSLFHNSCLLPLVSTSLPAGSCASSGSVRVYQHYIVVCGNMPEMPDRIVIDLGKVADHGYYVIVCNQRAGSVQDFIERGCMRAASLDAQRQLCVHLCNSRSVNIAHAIYFWQMEYIRCHLH